MADQIQKPGRRRRRAELRARTKSVSKPSLTSEVTPTPPPIEVEVDAPKPPDSLAAISLTDEVGDFSGPRSSTKRKLPWPHRAFFASGAVVLGLLVVLVAYAARDRVDMPAIARVKWDAVSAFMHRRLTPEPQPAPLPATDPLPPREERADAKLERAYWGHIPGGIVYLPTTFNSEDGAYDLFLHFHGNVKVINESAEVAGLNAVVAIVNLGINSAPYTDAYAVPGTYESLLGSVNRAVAEKGLRDPHIRRVALSSWSGGYGAISMILEQRKGVDPLDIIAVEDGIHCGYLDDGLDVAKQGHGPLNTRILMPFTAAAKQAAEGKFLFTITHSQIEPVGYAGTYLTSAYLMKQVGGVEGPPGLAPEHLTIVAAEGAVSKKLEKHMEPVSEGRVGSFHVRGYKGNTPEHHMAHLLQIGATILPEIVERWKPPHN